MPCSSRTATSTASRWPSRSTRWRWPSRSSRTSPSGASLVSENKSLCHPASVDSIPTSAGQEDHVSMGNASALKAWQVVANSERALAIELLAGAQAVEFLAPLEPGRGARATYDAVRSLSPRLRDDRPLSTDIEAVATAVRDGSLLAAVETEVGELE